MKPRYLLPVVCLFSTYQAVAQADSPYARFGYEGKVLRTPQERQQRMMLLVPNTDTTSAVAQVGLDPATQRYYLFGKDNQVLKTDTLAGTDVARFLSVDPLTKSYPHLTPYQFASNNPILNIDLDGLEGVDYTKNIVLSFTGKPIFSINDKNNTARLPIYVSMLSTGAIYVMHNDKGIEFNPSSAPTLLHILVYPGYYYALNIRSFSKTLADYTDYVLPNKINDITGVDINISKGGFANTFRHFTWQSMIAMSLGQKAAEMAGDYHERDAIVNAQDGSFIKDNVIDLLNNSYAREYAKGFNFNEVTKDINSFAGYLNGLVQHLTSTVDGYKEDKQFDALRSGEQKLFNSEDQNTKNLYEASRNLTNISAK